VNNIQELQEVIRKVHGSFATHVETVPVKEMFQGQTVWEGQVEVFDLRAHPRASRVYAWSHETNDADNPRRHVTVFHTPSVTSPAEAVQALIVSDFREQQANESNSEKTAGVQSYRRATPKA
jgi:predicted sulfurtransferase